MDGNCYFFIYLFIYFIYFLFIYNSFLWTDVPSSFRASDITLSCIVFVLLIVIGVLIWRRKRALTNNRIESADNAVIDETVQSALPREQHTSKPDSYMELCLRPSEGQSRVPPEYTSLQGSHVASAYYNVGFEKGKKGKQKEEMYEQIEVANS